MDDFELMNLIDKAKHGDKEATQYLCSVVSKALYSKQQIPQILARYFAGSLARYGRNECTLKSAFAPLGRQPSRVLKARREMDDISIIRAIETKLEEGLTTSKDGDIGPAFVEAGEMLDIPPSTLSGRYYRLKKKYQSREDNPLILDAKRRRKNSTST